VSERFFSFFLRRLHLFQASFPIAPTLPLFFKGTFTPLCVLFILDLILGFIILPLGTAQSLSLSPLFLLRFAQLTLDTKLVRVPMAESSVASVMNRPAGVSVKPEPDSLNDPLTAALLTTSTLAPPLASSSGQPLLSPMDASTPVAAAVAATTATVETDETASASSNTNHLQIHPSIPSSNNGMALINNISIKSSVLLPYPVPVSQSTCQKKKTTPETRFSNLLRTVWRYLRPWSTHPALSNI